MAQITLNGSYSISAYLGDDDVIYYLSSNLNGKHIRPNNKYWNAFYEECDNFQKLIINPKTNYKATFSVIEETDEGYTRKFEDFIFPTSEGDYNIDASSYGFNTYTTRLSKIGEFYDELFTDNLYRSMTHEAIKNFDWTYTREYVEGDEEEYVLGGQKVQKALRVFAREFDEITPGEFYKLIEGFEERKEQEHIVFSYFVSCLMNIEGKSLKSPLSVEDIMKPLIGRKTSSNRKADEEYLKKVFKI